MGDLRTMIYELWDFETANLLAASTDEGEILAHVRNFLEEDGPGYLDGIGFRAIDEAGKTRESLTGAALVARVRRYVAA